MTEGFNKPFTELEESGGSGGTNRWTCEVGPEQLTSMNFLKQPVTSSYLRGLQLKLNHIT